MRLRAAIQVQAVTIEAPGQLRIAGETSAGFNSQRREKPNF